MAVVYGFGGLRLKESGLHLRPWLPEKWQSYRFKICYQNTRIAVVVERDRVILTRERGEPVNLFMEGAQYRLEDQLVVSRA